MLASMEAWPRIVVHADMDAFYAAVEQMDDPRLRGKPVLVGPRSSRGVVLAASYEARRCGVGSAMPVAKARRLCPQAVTVPPRFDRYVEISERVMRVFTDFSPKVEALSLDEAFLDMSGAERLFGSPAAMGRRIKDAVRRATGLTISVGVSCTKHVAKVASAHDKPDGLTIVAPAHATKWLAPLPVARLWGAGPKTVPRMAALGLHTIGDVAVADPGFLEQRLGSLGARFHALANGRDPRPVRRQRQAGSIGSDRTLAVDVSARTEIERHLRRAAERIGRRVRAKGCVAGGVRVRLKTSGFRMLTRQTRLRRPAHLGSEFLAAGKHLLRQFDHPGPFRLVGMAVYDLAQRETPWQLDLLEDASKDRLETALDELAGRFGSGVVVRARDLRHPGTVTNGVNLDFMDAMIEADEGEEPSAGSARGTLAGKEPSAGSARGTLARKEP